MRDCFLKHTFIFIFLMSGFLSNICLNETWAEITKDYEVERLLKVLESSEQKEELLNAIQRLGRIGVGDKVKIALKKLFLNKDEEIRENALTAIQYIFQLEKFEFLLKIIKSSNPSERKKGIESLYYLPDRLYLEDERVYDTLFKGLSDPDVSVVSASAVTLGMKGEKRALPYLLNLMKADFKEGIKEHVSSSIVSAFVLNGVDAVPYIIQGLEEKKIKYIHNKLLDALLLINEPFFEKIIPVYLKADTDLKLSIIDVLNLSGEKDKLSDFYSDRLMEEEHLEVVLSLIKSFEKVPVTKKVLTDLIYMLVDDDIHIHGAVESVLKIHAHENLDFLLSLLGKADFTTRKSLLFVLGKLAKKDNLILNAFLNMLKVEKNLTIWKIVLYYVSISEREEAIPVLIDLFKSSDEKTLDYISNALIRLGSKERLISEITSKLIPFLKDEFKLRRLTAIYVLSEIGDANNLNLFFEILNSDDDTEARLKAASGLENWLVKNNNKKEAVSILLNEFKREPDRLQNNFVAKLLISMGDIAVPDLLSILEKGLYPDSIYAAWVLAHIGEKSAIPAIKLLLKKNPDSGMKVSVRSNDYSLLQIDALEYSLNLLEGKSYNKDK